MPKPSDPHAASPFVFERTPSRNVFDLVVDWATRLSPISTAVRWLAVAAVGGASVVAAFIGMRAAIGDDHADRITHSVEDHYANAAAERAAGLQADRGQRDDPSVLDIGGIVTGLAGQVADGIAAQGQINAVVLNELSGDAPEVSDGLATALTGVMDGVAVGVVLVAASSVRSRPEVRRQELRVQNVVEEGAGGLRVEDFRSLGRGTVTMTIHNQTGVDWQEMSVELAADGDTETSVTAHLMYASTIPRARQSAHVIFQVRGADGAPDLSDAERSLRSVTVTAAGHEFTYGIDPNGAVTEITSIEPVVLFSRTLQSALSQGR